VALEWQLQAKHQVLFLRQPFKNTESHSPSSHFTTVFQKNALLIAAYVSCLGRHACFLLVKRSSGGFAIHGIFNMV
jgi:hypothetical protein